MENLLYEPESAILEKWNQEGRRIPLSQETSDQIFSTIAVAFRDSARAAKITWENSRITSQEIHLL